MVDSNFIGKKDLTKWNNLGLSTISNIETNQDATELFLTTNIGILKFDAFADCCSDSWIEHFESISKAENFISFESIEINKPLTSPTKRPLEEMDSVEQYFYKITTDKSTYLIEMRNNSNGYYGGNLHFKSLIKEKT